MKSFMDTKKLIPVFNRKYLSTISFIILLVSRELLQEAFLVAASASHLCVNLPRYLEGVPTQDIELGRARGFRFDSGLTQWLVPVIGRH